MAKPSKAVLDFMEKYNIESNEIWEAHGSTWVVKHKALERVAVEVGIVWLRPAVQVCDLAAKMAVICAFGRIGDREEWSFGEASPANNKNSYPMAMAEKRARDRVILKLLVSHGALYSESEADEFTQPEKRQNPHVTRASDIHDEISDDIQPSATTQIFEPKMKVKDARLLYPVLINEMQRIQDPQELFLWGQAKADEIHALPGEWPLHFKGEYAKHKRAITNGGTA
jgi:hypothetical protein